MKVARFAIVLTLLPVGASAAPSPSASTSASASPTPCPPEMVAVDGGAIKDTTIAAHCLDKTEVTSAAYAACVKKGKCTAADAWNDGENRYCNSGRDDRKDDPVNCVDHVQAEAYCASLGKRLPTEAEWEWSARGYEKGTKYPWGDDAPGARACWDGPGNKSGDREGTCPVGKFKDGANPRGVLDLAGNVWEWTSTAVGDGKFVDKGGCFANAIPSRLLATDRNVLGEKFRSGTLGFRCLKTR
ncbi:MAG: formylglycine-generating enzyme family protein [Polyangiales bacterium]